LVREENNAFLQAADLKSGIFVVTRSIGGGIDGSDL
jgi:hypothetical protein